MKVKIVRYFNYPDLKRQTPNNSFQWNEITFTEDDIEECDYLVILDHPKNDFRVKVNPNNIFHLCLEPSNEVSKYRQYANKKVSRIFNQYDTKNNNKLSHGALPWHLDRDFDYLSKLSLPDLDKEDKIAWITSNQRSSKGHVKRMDFLDRIKHLPFVELYGRGINPVDDKFEVLQKKKYAIAYENYKNDYYWTEKIVDCYLSYTMPIYYGCNKIADFFPKESYIALDPTDKHIDLFLSELIVSKKWEESKEAIEKARKLILNEYQLFPFIYNQIKKNEALKKENSLSDQKELVSFKGGELYFDNYPFMIGAEKKMYKLLRILNSKF